MSLYRIGTVDIREEEAGFDTLLSSAHGSRDRPMCMCTAEGVPMYVAKIAGKFFIKRMPNSGAGHAPSCSSYEPPAELSGLGEVMGSAIQENVDDGMTALKLGFALTKGAGRAAPLAAAEEKDSVKTDGSKLTLRGMLHYLWEQAGFHKWSPAMKGKRTWFVVRKFLLHAAQGKQAKGSLLADMVFIPESFVLEKKDEITQRRLALMSKIAGQERGARRLMVAIGEVKEISPSRFGHKIVMKHLPDFYFMMNDDLHKRINKRFGVELELWNAHDDAHLIVIATFGYTITGVAQLEEVALMVVNENWIPIENSFDKTLIDTLSRDNRRFVKGLRYNLLATRPLACVVLADTAPAPVAMYVVPPGSTDEFGQALDSLLKDSNYQSWVWRASLSSMPAIPARAPAPRPQSRDDAPQASAEASTWTRSRAPSSRPAPAHTPAPTDAEDSAEPVPEASRAAADVADVPLELAAIENGAETSPAISAGPAATPAAAQS